ncbi:hypothetical protein HMPREF2996_02520 [Corynebacterium sp. HMSC066C02]|nr:hypothetical protein HMPREF2996_02520 [Corynebacterium sp. HMSC066C02]
MIEPFVFWGIRCFFECFQNVFQFMEGIDNSELTVKVEIFEATPKMPNNSNRVLTQKSMCFIKGRDPVQKNFQEIRELLRRAFFKLWNYKVE